MTALHFFFLAKCNLVCSFYSQGQPWRENSLSHRQTFRCLAIGFFVSWAAVVLKAGGQVLECWWVLRCRRCLVGVLLMRQGNGVYVVACCSLCVISGVYHLLQVVFLLFFSLRIIARMYSERRSQRARSKSSFLSDLLAARGSLASAFVSRKVSKGLRSPRDCLASCRSCVTRDAAGGMKRCKRKFLRSLFSMPISPLDISHSDMQRDSSSGRAASTYSALVLQLVTLSRWNCISSRRNHVYLETSTTEKAGSLTSPSAAVELVGGLTLLDCMSRVEDTRRLFRGHQCSRLLLTWAL